MYSRVAVRSGFIAVRSALSCRLEASGRKQQVPDDNGTSSASTHIPIRLAQEVKGMATQEVAKRSESVPSLVAPVAPADYSRPLAIVTTLFFMWGFLTCLNDILVPHLKSIFELSYARVMLVQFAFFSAYFLFSIPWSRVVNTIGYQKTMVVGLLTMAAGAFLFLPAASAAAAHGGSMVVNTEWGSFDNALKVLPNTQYDIDLDKESVNPGIQMFEKRVSGMFLGEILRIALVSMMKKPDVPLFRDDNSSHNDYRSTTTVDETDYWGRLAGRGQVPPLDSFASMLQQVRTSGPSGFDPRPSLARLSIPVHWVFADDDRAMGLVVDEIIDIVEERLHIEVASSRDGVLGSAVIKGLATEVIDVGHFLPMAFSDWFNRKEMRPSNTAQSVLLVDDSAFFRNMLAPVLKAAGYKVRVASDAQEGLSVLRSGQEFDVILTDIEMPDMNGFEFAETIRADSKLASTPIIALSAMISPAAIERGRQAGFHDYVAKFDRPGLIAALKEQTIELNRAA